MANDIISNALLEIYNVIPDEVLSELFAQDDNEADRLTTLDYQLVRLFNRTAIKDIRLSSGKTVYVEIDRCKSNLSSGKDHLDVWVFIKNNSEFDIEVTRINFLGRGAAGCFLGAGGSREIRIYSGDTPKNDAYKTAQVQYKITESGDYFQTNHYVEYSYEQDGDDEYYVPEEFKLDRVVKDI
jgi:hypothetical protein